MRNLFAASTQFVAAVALAACASSGARTPAPTNDMQARANVARTLADIAARVAVSKPGARVCRQVAVGISERDWIRGIVVEVGGDRIRIRIEDAGRFAQTLESVALARGLLIWDSPLNWTPCV